MKFDLTKAAGEANRRTPIKRLAKLHPDEESSWTFYFTYYVINQKKSNSEADRLTWRDMRREYPRLRLFDGAKP